MGSPSARVWASALSPLTVPASLYRRRRRAHTLGPCPRGQLPAWLQGRSKLGTAAPRTGTGTKLGAVRPHSTDGCVLPTLQSQAPAAAQMLGKRPFPPAPGAPRTHPILPCKQLLSPARPVPTLRDPRAALSSRHQCPRQETHTCSEASPRQEGSPGRGPGGHRCNTQFVGPPCVEFSQPLRAASGLWVSGGAGRRGSGDA